jgi:ABC-type multidrug transport system permease subunit
MEAHYDWVNGSVVYMEEHYVGIIHGIIYFVSGTIFSSVTFFPCLCNTLESVTYIVSQYFFAVYLLFFLLPYSTLHEHVCNGWCILSVS